MTAPRILHLITTLDSDGAQTQLSQLARRIDPNRYRIEIAYLIKGRAARRGSSRAGAPVGVGSSAGSAGSSEAASGAVIIDPTAGVPIHDLSRNGRFDPMVLFRLARMIGRGRFDLIHTHLVHAGIVGKAAARLAGGIPCVTTRHYASEGKEGTLPYRVEDRMTSACAAVIAVSESVREHLIERAIAPADRIFVVPNGVDVDIFDPSRFAPAGARGDRIGPPRQKVIGSIGRLCEQKGHAILIAAVPAILSRHPGARIEIAGDGPLRGELESQASRLGLSERVRICGPVAHPEVPERIAGWDLFVMPSRWEGFGIAAAEAMAMGKPVVASAVEGLIELVQDEVTGILVPPDRPASLAAAISRLLDDEDLRVRMGRAGRERASASFSIRMAASKTEEIYRLVLGR